MANCNSLKLYAASIVFIASIFSVPVTGRCAVEREVLQKRAEAVYFRLVAVADNMKGITPTLTFESNAKDLANASPQGIKMSYQLLEKAYADGARSGDARIAFVLGHELAHLYKEHIRSDRILADISEQIDRGNYMEALRFSNTRSPFLDIEQKLEWLNKTKGSKRNALVTEFKQLLNARRHELELEADRIGVSYMLQAGFDPRLVESEKVDFIYNIVSEAEKKGPTREHPSAKARRDRFLAAVTPVIERFPLFRTANRLYQLQDYEAARETYEKLIADPLNGFATKEVFNNLGLACYQSALSRTECINERYEWHLGLLLEPLLPQEVSLKGSTGESVCRNSGTFIRAMDNAVQYFQKALVRDPAYLMAHINLAASFIMQREYDKAVVQAAEVLKTNPEHTEAKTVQAVATFLRKPADSSIAVHQLRQVIEKNPDASSAIYNLARVLFLNGKKDEAEALWQEYLHKHPRNNFSRYLNVHLKGELGKTASKGCDMPAPPVGLSLDLSEIKGKLPGKNAKLLKEKLTEIDLTILVSGDLRITAFDSEIVLVEREAKGNDNRNPEYWRKKLGLPDQSISLSKGSVHLYHPADRAKEPYGFGIEIIDGLVTAVFWYAAWGA